LRYTYPITQATAITLLDVIAFTRQAKKNGENADSSDEACFDDRTMAKRVGKSDSAGNVEILTISVLSAANHSSLTCS